MAVSRVATGFAWKGARFYQKALENPEKALDSYKIPSQRIPMTFIKSFGPSKSIIFLYLRIPLTFSFLSVKFNETIDFFLKSSDFFFEKR